MHPFVHLHVHSHYSKGWGLATAEELCRAARRLSFATLALTDTNGLYGLIPFVRAARENGLSPIVGSELQAGGRRAVALVKTQTGYINLCHILSACHCHQDFDLIQALRERREGLIVFSDDFRLLKVLKRDAPEDLFVEMTPGYQMAAGYAFSRQSGIPPVATNRVALLQKEQFRLHRILRAMTLNTKLSRLRPEHTCREHNLLNAARDMEAQFPHAPAAIDNTARIARACRTEWDFTRLVFPCFDGLSDRDAFERLYREVLEGCRRRYGALTPAVRERVAHEMRIVGEKNFAHYFLVVADITRRARRACGRGSAAASIVAYALGITHVDPIRHNLFFERFLNLGRLDPPDIDVDFAWDERDEIMDYIFARYGHRRAAMVANHNTFGARAAVREVAKVFGLTEQEIEQVTGRIGSDWDLRTTDIARHPRMRGVTLTGPWKEILATAARLQTHFNHLSTHCGGVVVVPDAIRRYCPVQISARGVQVLKWEKDAVEESGLVKIDILGNRGLAVIRDALAQVETNTGRHIDYAALNPLHDAATIRVFYQADTFGVFYFESPATRQLLTKVRSGFTFEEYRRADHFHLNVVVTSIIRPASNHSIRTWIARLHGQPWEPLHPLLRPVLQETLGVMVFQEQLSQAAIHLAGFDPAEADALRKVVSKKHKAKKLRDFQARFIQGARARGVRPPVIKAVWEMMMGFDGYSFCKPHSASYTLVAYKSAFLRAHYPAEFMAAVISNGGGYYSTAAYLSETRRMGLRILPPDVNLSQIKSTGARRTVRIGLMHIKDLGAEAREALLHERRRRGPFTSVTEFFQRMGRHLRLQEACILIRAGALDRLARSASRARLLWQALAFFECPSQPVQAPLFSAAAPSAATAGCPDRPDPPYLRLRHELETLGFLLSCHPLALYREALAPCKRVRAADLPACVGREVLIAGWPLAGKTVHTRTGQNMRFISFEDPSGVFETVLFPDLYERYCHLLGGSRPYLLRGTVEEEFQAITLTIHAIRPLRPLDQQILIGFQACEDRGAWTRNHQLAPETGPQDLEEFQAA